MNIIVETTGLEKRFGKTNAVDGLDLSIEQGDVFGFLGPNGAGKSTTIRAMMGLVRPTNGTIRMFDHDVWSDREKALAGVGALVESPGLYRYLTGRQNLWAFAKLIGAASKDNIDLALKRVGLVEKANAKVKTYSHGMKQRLGIAQALVGDPKLVILDEPTNGLDPQGMMEVRQLIRSLAVDHGITIFLSSHLLHEVQQVCTKVAVIFKGKKVASGLVADLLAGNGRVSMTVTRPVEAAAAIEKFDGIKVHSVNGTGLVLDGADGRSAEINRYLVTNGFDVSAIIPETKSLEDFYFSLVGQQNGNSN